MAGGFRDLFGWLSSPAAVVTRKLSSIAGSLETQGRGNFRIDLLDADTGAKVGSTPIRSVAQVTRQTILSKVGRWTFAMSPADPTLSIIEGKDLAVYWQHNGLTHYLGIASYMSHDIQPSGVQVQASCSLRDLTRQTVLERAFDGATDDVNDVLSTIVPLRSGWSLGDVDTITTAAPMDFWYETIFQGVAVLAETFGYHFREGSTPKTLDFGAFGASSGVLAVGGDHELPYDVYGNADLCQISDIRISYQGERVVNRLIPFGGALGVATIDLSETTSTQAGYPVQSAALPGGGSYYYIEDTTSQSTYGLTERRFLRKDLRPIVNTKVAREYAANILYEATLASLLNLKDRQTIYELSVIGLQPGQMKVGDKINVLYRGWVDTLSGTQSWLDVDSTTQPGQGKEFYVLEIEETFGVGVTTRLKINENAVREETVEDLLASTIHAFEQSQIHVQPTASRYTVGPYVKRVSYSPSVDAEFSFKLGSETLDIWFVKILITGEPLKSSVTTSASGGSSTPTTSSTSHQHTTLVLGSSAGDTVRFDGNNLNCDTSGTLYTSLSGSHNHSVTIPSHTHAMTYGIYEDGTYPDSLTIKVNGSTVASGVTLNAGNDYTYELDITDDILAAATLQQEHTITVEAGSGRGEIQFQAQVLAVIQPITIS